MAALQVFIVRFFFQVRIPRFDMCREILTIGIRVPERVMFERIGSGMALKMIEMILGSKRGSVYYTLSKSDAQYDQSQVNWMHYSISMSIRSTCEFIHGLQSLI